MKTNKNILRRAQENGIELIQQYHEDCASTLDAIRIYKKQKSEYINTILRLRGKGLDTRPYNDLHKHCNKVIKRLYKRLEWQQSYIANYYHELRIENALDYCLDDIQVCGNEITFTANDDSTIEYYIEDISKYNLDNDDIALQLIDDADKTCISCCGEPLNEDIMLCPVCLEHC